MMGARDARVNVNRYRRAGAAVMPIAAIIFFLIALGCGALAASASRALGWTYATPRWAIAGNVVMWTPALARVLTTQTVDRGWTSPYPIATGTASWALAIVVPAIAEIAIYGVSSLIGVWRGAAAWAPAWKGTRAAANLALNLPILMAAGFLASAGEEIGWRGYLQPRLEQAGLPAPFAIVGVLWALFHVPIMWLAGYEPSRLSPRGFALFAANCISDSYIWWRASAAVGSLAPAIWFHAFHNIASQWLAPRFFPASAPQWLGEHGIIPVVVHAVVAVAVAYLFPVR
jgi:membrane protease YdiL (CAAX protease family)